MEKKPKSAEELDRDRQLSLDILAKTDGGMLITNALLKDIESSITRLSAEYRSLSHIEMIGVCAELSSRLGLYKALTRAGKNVKELDVIIKEALADTDE
jgi:hypothetical protein